MSIFENGFNEKNEGAGNSWGGFGEEEFGIRGGDEKVVSIQDTMRITGFIYTKKNYVSPSPDVKKGAAIYEKAFAEYKANAENPLSLNEKKITADGEIETTDRIITLDDKFSVVKLRTLNPELYKGIIENSYKVYLPERDVEYFVIYDTNRAERVKANVDGIVEKTQTELEIIENASASNDKFTVSLIKTKRLLEVLLSTTTQKLYIVNYNHSTPEMRPDILGFLTPVAEEITKDGKPSLKTKAVYINNESKKVAKLGDFSEVRRMCNRSYEGEAIPANAIIVNEEQVRKFDPSINPKQLKRLTTMTKKDLDKDGEFKTVQEKQAIPYSNDPKGWEELGVTEKMLAAIRTSTGSSTTISDTKLSKVFRESIDTFNRLRVQ